MKVKVTIHFEKVYEIDPEDAETLEEAKDYLWEKKDHEWQQHVVMEEVK